MSPNHESPYPPNRSTMEYRLAVLERFQALLENEGLAKTLALAEERSKQSDAHLAEVRDALKTISADVRSLLDTRTASQGFTSTSKGIIATGLVTLVLLGGFLLNLYVVLGS